MTKLWRLLVWLCRGYAVYLMVYFLNRFAVKHTRIMSNAVANTGLSNFLSTSKNNWETNKGSDSDSVYVCIGNESCDLDTAVSSITYCYYWYLITGNSNLFLPVINVERRNYPVKTEVTYFLSKNSIEEDSLLFKDDVDIRRIHKEEKLKLVLVDHHVLTTDLAGLEKSVIKILDHRPKDKLANWPDSILRLENVGSCTTLVGDELRQKNLLVDKQVARLLYGTIVLDTNGFSTTLKKFTELDREIAELCRTVGEVEESEESLHKSLSEAKYDISRLSLEQLLSKDMKRAGTVTISTLTTLAKEFLTTPDADMSVQSFCKDQKADVCMLLGRKMVGDEYMKDICIYNCGNNSQLVDLITERLTNNKDLKLEYAETVNGNKLYWQKNLTLTRKYILPIVEIAFKDTVNKPDL